MEKINAIVEDNMDMFMECKEDMKKHGMLVSFGCVYCGKRCSWDDFIMVGYDPREVMCSECRENNKN